MRFPIHTTVFPIWSSRINLLPPWFLLRRRRAPLEAEDFLSVQGYSVGSPCLSCFCWTTKGSSKSNLLNVKKAEKYITVTKSKRNLNQHFLSLPCFMDRKKGMFMGISHFRLQSYPWELVI
ncbi:hypothetical protein AABB24_014584 [Solanum stoloniferum]|uniref:Uncharacterized protein n=1 Tax=Solanum stoloniferum TaxID=62892 RepID=A0ABD2TZB7_9SOLN